MSDLLTNDPKALQLLFNEELYLLKNTEAKAEAVQLVPQSPEMPAFNYLGENNRFFLLLADEPGHAFLGPSNLELLTKILQAKGLELKDVAILNLSHYPDVDFEQLKPFFSCSKLCLFGVSPGQIRIPELASNEPATHKEVKILATFSLKELQQTQHKKVAFWNAMKNF